MYNQKLKLKLIAASPFAYELGDETLVGITITAELKTKKLDFFDDAIRDKTKRKNVAAILAGDFPIADEFAVQINKVKEAVCQIDDGPANIPCEVKKMFLTPWLVENGIKAMMKIVLKNLSDSSAGDIVGSLKNTITVKINVAQKDIFDEEDKGIKVADEAD